MERQQRRGSIWAACSIIGVAVGMIIASLTGAQMWLAIGAMLGVGTAFVLNTVIRR